MALFGWLLKTFEIGTGMASRRAVKDNNMGNIPFFFGLISGKGSFMASSQWGWALLACIWKWLLCLHLFTKGTELGPTWIPWYPLSQLSKPSHSIWPSLRCQQAFTESFSHQWLWGKDFYFILFALWCFCQEEAKVLSQFVHSYASSVLDAVIIVVCYSWAFGDSLLHNVHLQFYSVVSGLRTERLFCASKSKFMHTSLWAFGLHGKVPFCNWLLI